MASAIICHGCRRPLPEHHGAFIGNLEYNLWAREGYCSFFCFRENAPEELIRKDDEQEAHRQERLSLLDGTPALEGDTE